MLTLAHTVAHLKASVVGFHGYIRGVKAECCSVQSRPALLSMCSLSQYEWKRDWTLVKCARLSVNTQVALWTPETPCWTLLHVFVCTVNMHSDLTQANQHTRGWGVSLITHLIALLISLTCCKELLLYLTNYFLSWTDFYFLLLHSSNQSAVKCVPHLLFALFVTHFTKCVILFSERSDEVFEGMPTPRSSFVSDPMWLKSFEKSHRKVPSCFFLSKWSRVRS